MMRTSFCSIIFGFALLSTTSAVQLANFETLTISNAQCRAAYTTTIEGCQASDFEPNGSARCTAACVAGLKKIGEVVKRVCKDVDLGDASIIGVFKLDLGVTALCPRIASATSSANAPQRTSAQPSPTSSKAQSPTPASSTLITSSSTSSPTSTSTSVLGSSSQSEVAQSSSTSSQGLIVDPNPTSIAVAPSPPSSTKVPASNTAPVPQLSNADSGGGSPFDVQAGRSASSRLQVIDLTMAAFIGTALLFSACA